MKDPETLETDESEPPKPAPVLPREFHQAVHHLAVALNNESILIAAELNGAKGEDLWFGLGTVPAELPDLGWGTNGGSRFEPLFCSEFVMENCDGASRPTATPTPPEEMAQCKETLAKYEFFKRTHQGRFRKIFRIGQDSVKVLLENGQLESIPNAKLAWKKSDQKTTVEVWLPIGAMPRVAEAPLSTVNLVARLASSATPTFPKDAWFASNLPKVVSFEPYGDIRAALWDAVNTGPINLQSPTTLTRFRPPTGLSYHPSEPLKVESVEAGPDKAEAKENTLFLSQAKLGDIDVLRAHASHDFVVILKGGKFLGLVDVEDSSSKGVINRNGELHVFNLTSEPWSSEWHASLPFWSVIVVDKDGKYREAIERTESPFDSECHRFVNGTPSVDKKLEVFGFQGQCTDALDRGKLIQIVHKWDARKKSYSAGTWSVK